MTSDLIGALVRANLVGSAAILAVVILRKPIRHYAGARLAYGLWLLVPLLVAAAFMPAAQVEVVLEPATASLLFPPALDLAGAPGSAAPAPVGARIDPALLLLIIWAAGVLLGLVRVVWRQVRFVRELGPIARQDSGLFRAEHARHGPSVIGLVRPRIVLPADFEARFSPAEQDLIIAHETRHVRAGHVQITALAVAIQWLNWFNPLAHLAVHLFRIDQELACDEAVIGAQPRRRRSYAKAMIKTQVAGLALPLGCYWPARGAGPLRERIALLSRPIVGRRRRLIAGSTLSLVALIAAVGAWAAQPPVVRTVVRSASAAPGALAAKWQIPAAFQGEWRPTASACGKADPVRMVLTPDRLTIRDNSGPVMASSLQGSHLTVVADLSSGPQAAPEGQSLQRVFGFDMALAQDRLTLDVVGSEPITLVRCTGIAPAPSAASDARPAMTAVVFDNPPTTQTPVPASNTDGDAVRSPAAAQWHAPQTPVVFDCSDPKLQPFFRSSDGPSALFNGQPVVVFTNGKDTYRCGTPASPVVAQQVLQQARPSTITAPEWASMPRSTDLAAAFPGAALRFGVGGWVMLQCKVSAEGALGECSVAAETQGYGFGQAALNLASRFVMRPQTRDGVAQDGAWVNIPVLFSVNGAEPAFPPMTLRPIPATEVRKVIIPGTYLTAGSADESLR